MNKHIPRVAIGIPVYNGENYLEATIQSLLRQTYEDFEIIVSDNASTDRTADIVREYMKCDPRVRYHRNQVNVGCTGNFNGVFSLSESPYFKWAPHDDLYEPEFLEKCVGVLDSDPTVVLCYTLTSIIDSDGNIVRRHEEKLRSDANQPHIRFHDLLVNFMAYEIYGVIRTDALRKTPLFGGFGHEDGVLLAHLGLIGKFREVPEYLYLNREHPQKSWNFYKNYRDYTVWLVPSKAGKILLPRWRMGFEFVKSIGAVPLSLRQRVLCYAQMGHWIRVFWKSLIANLAVASVQLLALPFRKMRLLQTS